MLKIILSTREFKKQRYGVNHERKFAVSQLLTVRAVVIFLDSSNSRNDRFCFVIYIPVAEILVS